MVTKSDILVMVEQINHWQNLLLRGHKCAMFFIWLSDHTKMEIHPETFQEKLTEHLLGMSDARGLYSEVLTIHAEILWASHKAEHETFHFIERNP